MQKNGQMTPHIDLEPTLEVPTREQEYVRKYDSSDCSSITRHIYNTEEILDRSNQFKFDYVLIFYRKKSN